VVAATEKGDQLITSASPWVIAYDPLKGTEIWKAEVMGGDVAPSPVYASGLVFTVNIDAELVAIRPDGQGDVTETHVAWRGEDGLPDICSPVSNGSLIFLLTTSGKVTCYDVGSGDVVWAERIKLPCHSSPSLVENRLYIFSKKGVLVILEAGKEYRELGRHELGEAVETSPAFTEGRLYIRGHNNLYCLSST
jgi:outer membrane protein assembly factor BamB